MSRTFFLLLFSILAWPLFGQEHGFPIDENTNLISYEGIVEMPDYSKQVLYDRALEWIRENYKNPGSVFMLRDAENGKMEGKHQFNLWKNVDGERIRSGSLIKYTITLWFKSEKYRYRISKLNLQQTTYFPLERWLEPEKYEQPQVQDYLKQTDEYLTKLIESLKQYMETDEVEYDEDEW